jgi:hypothetical protein
VGGSGQDDSLWWFVVVGCYGDTQQTARINELAGN